MSGNGNPAAAHTRSQPWDARAYDRAFSYVSTLAGSLIELLGARPGESVVDLGCGTGDLTARIAETGVEVRGIDRDEAMIAEARRKFPAIAFDRADAQSFTVPHPVDAVISNAALHWMTRPDDVIVAVARALRPGGRFVAEFGAGGNVAALIDGMRGAVADLGLHQPVLPWYFPTPAEHAVRLESGGFEIRRLDYFPRPTPLAQGETAAGWWRMFGPSVLEQLPAASIGAVLARVDERLAPRIVDDTGAWVIDYVRLRFVAIRR